MIVSMIKYHFLIFHKEYNSFLKDLQNIGVVHVVEKDKNISLEIRNRYNEVNDLKNIIHFLQKRNIAETEYDGIFSAKEIVDEIVGKQKELENLQSKLEELQKALSRGKIWGDFSHDLIQQLEERGIKLLFYNTNKKKFLEIEKAGHPVELISEQGNQVVFSYIQTGNDTFKTEEERIQLPPVSQKELKRQIEAIQYNIKSINICFDEYAKSSIKLLQRAELELLQKLEFENVIENTTQEADHKLMILEGWVPKTKDLALNQYLEEHSTLFIKNKPTPNDKIPVLLKNNRFAKLFEPIGSMFSLPDYAELDLTVFFAPFFMLFFGFCLGDAGYGLLFLIGGGLYKLKAKRELKPLLSLIQFLGLATILFGTISGTLFGINLIETEFALTENIRGLFLNPDKMFNLALVLGAVQIIFGLFIKAANQTKQFGFTYSLATYGWLIILLGSIGFVSLTGAGLIPKNKTFLYAILGAGGFFVLFFSDPGVNIFARVGKGIWDIYSTVTGIFGDLLSYIRLFALGLSSAILGFVINDIGLQILGASKILGPVFFVLFLLLGHTLNILISSLGSFVHPMRLTFVEFYKSAGFKGGGEKYNPFKKLRYNEE